MSLRTVANLSGVLAQRIAQRLHGSSGPTTSTPSFDSTPRVVPLSAGTTPLASVIQESKQEESKGEVKAAPMASSSSSSSMGTFFEYIQRVLHMDKMDSQDDIPFSWTQALIMAIVLGLLFTGQMYALKSSYNAVFPHLFSKDSSISLRKLTMNRAVGMWFFFQFLFMTI